MCVCVLKKQDYHKNGLKGYTLYMVIIVNMLFHLYILCWVLKQKFISINHEIKY